MWGIGMSLLERWRHQLMILLGTILGWVWLVCLYALTFWLVVGSLSAIQVRDNVAGINLPFTFNNVGDAEAALQRAQDRIYDGLRRKDVLWQKQNEQADLLVRIEGNFGKPDTTYDNSYFSDPESMPFFQDALRSCGERPADGALSFTPCDDLYRYQDLGRELDELYKGDALQKITDSETAAQAQFQKLKQLSDFVNENNFFETFRFTIFLKAPREILVMVLTIIMGVLGSVITMTWTFVRHDSELSVRRFLLLPLVGGMSAFIILIFLKAGQLTLTAGETKDELSPFVLSFVGIISGLLSERAYSRMAEVGGSVFQVQERNMRWGINLTTALAVAGVPVETVGRYLGLETADAEEIVLGKAPADPSQQRLIAALLRAETREVFTDIPPAESAPPRPTPGEPAV